jgi:hypothetical protein
VERTVAYIAPQQDVVDAYRARKNALEQGDMMKQSKRAIGGLDWWAALKRIGSRGMLAAAGLAAAGGAAKADAGCPAVNRGYLNVALERESSTNRQIVVAAGDKLTFSFEGAAGPLGSVTLRTGAGAPRSLLFGPSGTQVSFVAAKSGPFDFEFGKEGAETAEFTASCEPAGGAGGRTAPAPSRRGTRLLGGTLKDTELPEGDESAGVVLDAGVSRDLANAAKPLVARPAPAVPTVPLQAQGLDTKLQWRGERYRTGGPDGFQIDTSTSGVDAAVNYKLLPEIMIGALAQVDQPGESIIGAPPSLSERGWLAGPVTSVKLAPGLTLEARAAWGVTESSPDELSPHTASMPRRLVSAKLANTQSFGPWRISPSVSVNHAYDAAAVSYPAAAPHDDAAPHAAGFGRVDVGPEFAYRIDMGRAGFIEPRAVIGTFWDFDTLSRLAPGTADHNDLRLKAEAGVTIGGTGGTKVQAAGAVEEGAAGAADVWSGRLQLSVPMQ